MEAFRGKTHILIAALVSLIIVRVTQMALGLNTFLFLGGALIGSLLPDTDCKDTKAGICIPLWLFFKQRTITHSIWAILLMAVITKVHSYIGYGLFVGVTSHIAADLFTASGCCFFYPFFRERQRFAALKINSKEEGRIRIVVGALLIVLIGIYAWDVVRYLTQQI